MKINVVAEHALHGSIVAKGIEGIKEEVLTRNFAKEITKQLIEKRHEVKYIAIDKAITTVQELKEEVLQINTNESELNIVVHFNYYNGQAKGSEILTYKGKDIYNALWYAKRFKYSRVYR